MASEQIQDEILRKMTAEEKLSVALELYYSARRLKAAWYRQEHADWSEEQVEAAVREAFLNART